MTLRRRRHRRLTQGLDRAAFASRSGSYCPRDRGTVTPGFLVFPRAVSARTSRTRSGHNHPTASHDSSALAAIASRLRFLRSATQETPPRHPGPEARDGTLIRGSASQCDGPASAFAAIRGSRLSPRRLRSLDGVVELASETGGVPMTPGSRDRRRRDYGSALMPKQSTTHSGSAIRFTPLKS